MILKLCGIQIDNLDRAIRTSQRTSPRTLDNLEPAALKELFLNWMSVSTF